MRRRDFLKNSALLAGATAAASVPRTAHATDKPAPPPVWPSPALASDPKELRSNDTWDYVIIGSGYGGAINAARIGDAFAEDLRAGNLKACVLERGREIIPGHFPQTLNTLMKDVTVRGNGTVNFLRLFPNKLGLLDVRVNDEMLALVGQGLGGTSLINSNIAVEPDDDLFEEKLPDGTHRWPTELRLEYQTAAMKPYYERAREMLGVNEIPKIRLPLKAKRMSETVEKAGGKGRFVDLTVNFDKDGTSTPAGIPLNQCTYCGDCITGCNVGAKRTVYTNYLPYAKGRGVRMFTQVRVKCLAKVGPNDYRLHLVRTYDARKPGRTVEEIIYARNVIVAAGALGTPEILMRSEKAGGLSISKQLGQRFSANGDLIGMSYGGSQRTDTLGFGTRTGDRAKIRSGPEMDFVEDGRVMKDPATGEWKPRPLRSRYWIMDGVFPSAIVRAIGKLFVFRKTDESSLHDFLSPKVEGKLNRSMLYLGAAHDNADAFLTLSKKDELKVHWPNLGDDPAFKILEKRFHELNDANEGTFTQPNPLSQFGRGMTVHPLGGCVMGETRETGAVDHRGRVFDSSRGDAKAIHEGLYVSDGSILPDSLGVNPFLTIAALSERIAEFIVGKRA